ncbi:MAG: hypothetical protein AB8H86_05535 [Polyangiales bacterium]
MGAVPALALLTTLAALADWSFGRAILRAWSVDDTMSHTSLLGLQNVALVVRNTAATMGLVALYGALAGWIRYRPFTPLALRVTIAGFAGVLLPTLTLATLLPMQRTSALIVLFTTIAAHVLILLTGTIAMHWRGQKLSRTGAALVTLASFSSFCAVTVLIIAQLSGWEDGHPLGMAIRRTGELCYLVALIILPLSLRPWRSTRMRIGLGIGLGISAAIGLFWQNQWQSLDPEVFSPLFYGATHLELVLTRAPMTYVVWIMAVLTLSAGAMLSESEPDQQLGAGTLLLLAAGFAPTTPFTLLLWCVGALLMTRALIARSTLPAIVAIRNAYAV